MTCVCTTAVIEANGMMLHGAGLYDVQEEHVENSCVIQKGQQKDMMFSADRTGHRYNHVSVCVVPVHGADMQWQVSKQQNVCVQDPCVVKNCKLEQEVSYVHAEIGAREHNWLMSPSVRDSCVGVQHGCKARTSNIPPEVEFEMTIKSASDVQGYVRKKQLAKLDELHGTEKYTAQRDVVVTRISNCKSGRSVKTHVVDDMQCDDLQLQNTDECQVPLIQCDVQNGLRRYHCKYMTDGCKMETILRDKGVQHVWICRFCRIRRDVYASCGWHQTCVKEGAPLLSSTSKLVPNTIEAASVTYTWDEYEGVMCQLIVPHFVEAVTYGQVIGASEYQILLKQMRTEQVGYDDNAHTCHFLVRKDIAIIAKFLELIDYGWEIIEQREPRHDMGRCTAREHMRRWIPKRMIGKYRRFYLHEISDMRETSTSDMNVEELQVKTEKRDVKLAEQMYIQESSVVKSGEVGDLTHVVHEHEKGGITNGSVSTQQRTCRGVNIRPKGSYCLVEGCGKPLQYDTFGYRRHLSNTREHCDLSKEHIHELVEQFKERFGQYVRSGKNAKTRAGTYKMCHKCRQVCSVRQLCRKPGGHFDYYASDRVRCKGISKGSLPKDHEGIKILASCCIPLN